jgi:7,8-dihydropterin-6-yl-methyl-4-(beta-D-ribofuranosyl)aminobenzene 5'-phosphate synthase
MSRNKLLVAVLLVVTLVAGCTPVATPMAGPATSLPAASTVPLTAMPAATAVPSLPSTAIPTSVPPDPLRITILYDNTAYDARLQEAWGFAALVEHRGHTLLFDTGGDPRVLLNNVDLLGVDLTHIEAIALSHIHGDHVDGLPGLVERGLCVPVYVLPSFPASFRNRCAGQLDPIAVEPGQELNPDVYTTGQMRDPAVRIHEQSLVIRTGRGLVIVTGCAHQGIVEVVRAAKLMFDEPVQLVLGGFHLVDSGTRQIEAVIAAFRELGVEQVAPTHCTGETAISMFADAYGDDFVPAGAGRVLVIEDEAGPAVVNGSLIAFVSDRDGNDEIYRMDADGGNQRRLTEHPADDCFPFWSPDGRYCSGFFISIAPTDKSGFVY